MNSIELSSTQDGTREHNTLFHRFTNEMDLPERISLANITMYHNWKNIAASRGNNWFYVLNLETDLDQKHISDIKRMLQLVFKGPIKTVNDLMFFLTNKKDAKTRNFTPESFLNDLPPYDEVIKKLLLAFFFNDYEYFEENSINIPDGSYAVEDLNNFIHLSMNRKEKKTDLEREFGINIYANPTYNRVSAVIDENYAIIFPKKLAETLGSDSQVLWKTEKNFENTPKIEVIEKIMVHCDLVQNDFQAYSNLLFTFTPDKKYGRLMSPQILFPIWKKTRSTKVKDVKIWLTDQNGKAFDFEDTWSVTLLLDSIGV